ncbi:kinase-like domain-containing protein [Haematococcus lacustris]
MPKPVLPTLGIAKARNFIDDQQDSGAQAAPSTRQQKQPQSQTLGTKPHLIEQPQKGPPLKHGASNIAHSGSFVAARPAGGSPSVAQKPPVPALSLTALGASSVSLSARDAPLLSSNSSSASSHALITAAALQRGAMTSRAPTQPGPPPPSRLPESSCGSSSSSSGAAAASAATSLQTPHGHSTSRTPRSSSRQQQQAGAVPGGQRGGGGVAAGAYTTAAAAPKAPEGTPPALGPRGGLGGSARLTPPTTTPAHTSHSTAAAAHSHPSQQTSTVSTATTTGVAPASRPVERPGAGRPGQGGGGVGAGVGTPPSTSSASASAGTGGSGAAASTAWESGSITPAQALKRYSEYLTPFEQSEILDYPSVYFVGRSGAQKVRGNPHATKGNYGYDDERGDYLIVPHDHLGYRYEVLGLLGKGSFGQVIKVHDFKANMLRAVKIIRNKKRFHHQALVELKVLQHLVGCDQADEHNIIHIKDHFTFRNHLCISFELLSLNLYEFVKQNNFVGLSLGLIRRFAHQILVTLSYLKTLRIIHCDLKPENILLRQPNRSAVKVIDFGSSCFTDEKVYTYIQSRFYRSPEVVLGLPYGCEIDMWSFGAILAELYTGSPLFPGEDEAEQLACIMEVLGPPPPDLLATASRRKLFFDSVGEPLLQPNSQGKLHLPGTRSLSSVLRCSDLGFLDLVEKCLRWSPADRITPNQALKHSWIMDNAPSPTPRNPPAAAKPHLPSQPVATLAATYLQQQQQAQQQAQQQQQQAAQQVLALQQQQQQQQQSGVLQHSSRHHPTYDQQQQQQYYLQQQQQHHSHCSQPTCCPPGQARATCALPALLSKTQQCSTPSPPDRLLLAARASPTPLLPLPLPLLPASGDLLGCLSLCWHGGSGGGERGLVPLEREPPLAAGQEGS